MITLFACPKSFSGHIEVIQRNAIKSWILLEPRPEIILLGDDNGIAEVCREFDLIHVPGVEKNEYGTPFVNSVFGIGQATASRPVVCYVNCDIILMDDFMSAISTVAAHMPKFLVVGQRWDVDILQPWDYSSASWETDLRSMTAREGALHSQIAMDFFAFPRGMYSDIPPFAIGRTRWDNWLMWRARSTGIPVVDATAAVTIIHQNHAWPPGKVTTIGDQSPAALPPSSGLAPAAIGLHEGKLVRFGPEAQRNQALAPGEKGVLDIWAATWMITKGGALRRRSFTPTPAFLKYQLKWVIPMKRPWVGTLYRSAASVRRTIRAETARLVSRS